MGRSGERARNLKRLLSRVATVPEKPTLNRPGWDALVAADLDADVQRVYRALGGVGDQPRIAPGQWDLQLDNVAVELDEENHFNRYRAATLEAAAYEAVAHVDVDAYREWCETHESECLTYGKYWTNASCEREFGPAGPRGELSGRGAPRWKQRAFYDFIKDLAPVAADVTVTRLSTSETLRCGPEFRRVSDLLYEDPDRLAAGGWGEAMLNRLRDRIL